MKCQSSFIAQPVPNWHHFEGDIFAVFIRVVFFSFELLRLCNGGIDNYRKGAKIKS